jgi:hypothetical protein
MEMVKFRELFGLFDHSIRCNECILGYIPNSIVI